MSLKSGIYKSMTPVLRRQLRSRSGVIGLCYHRFVPASGFDPIAGMAIHPDQFRMHLEALLEEGPFIPVADLSSGNSPSGFRFFLSFDDGYRDNLDVLLPIAESYGIPFALFVVGGVADGSLKDLPHDQACGYAPPLLTETDLRALDRHPLVTLGAHTQTHARLSELSKAAACEEITLGKTSLEAAIGHDVKHFAVPYGGREDARWEETFSAAARSGFQTVFSNCGGINGPGSDNPQGVRHLRRVSMGPIAEAWNVRGWVFWNAWRGGCV